MADDTKVITNDELINCGSIPERRFGDLKKALDRSISKMLTVFLGQMPLAFRAIEIGFANASSFVRSTRNQLVEYLENRLT